jgi:hypothetical protein
MSLWAVVFDLFGGSADSRFSSVPDTQPYEGREKSRQNPSEEKPKSLHSVRLLILEDNEAVIKLLQKGRTLAFRHVAKTHRINMDWVYDVVKHDDILVKYIRTDYQLGDMYTKAFPQKKKLLWSKLLDMSSFAPEAISHLPSTPAAPHASRVLICHRPKVLSVATAMA